MRRALGLLMGRKHHRLVTEPFKLPAPNPESARPTLPHRRRTTPTEVCSFENCKRVAGLYVFRGQVCEEHASRIWEYVEMRDATQRHEDIPGMEAREYIRADARKIKAVERRKPASVGQIYYVQVDGLIKVGWTTKLADRIRAYGPKAVLLVNYPATRADEAALHRQLTPSRFKGREWYSDTPIVRAFIDQALKKHGAPRFDQLHWTEPKPIVAGKRSTRRQ